MMMEKKEAEGAGEAVLRAVRLHPDAVAVLEQASNSNSVLFLKNDASGTETSTSACFPSFSAYTKVYSAIYDSRSVPQRATFSLRETSPVFEVRSATGDGWGGRGSAPRGAAAPGRWGGAGAGVQRWQ